MKSNIILSGMLLLLPFYCPAQGINILSGSYVIASGTATIRVVNGGFINNGTYSKGTETFIFGGSVAGIISGKGITNANRMEISNSGGITTRMSQLTSDTLNINSGSSFTIDTASAVNVNRHLLNSAGKYNLWIRSKPNAANGSLIFHNLFNDSVQATVEMYSKAAATNTNPYSNYKWQFFGVPLRSVVANPTFTGSYIRKYNEAGNGTGTTSVYHWITLGNSSVLTPFSGYEVTQATPTTFSFSGTLVNADYSSGQLSYTSTADYPGQHLIGNPYTSAIDIKQLAFGTSDTTIMENTVYLYNTGSYNDWVAAGSGISTDIYATTVGQYTAVPYHLAGNTGIPGQIPSMQAFLIIAYKSDPTATLSVPYSSASTVVKNTELQRGKKQQLVSTHITVSGTKSAYGDQMWIFSVPDCSRGFDNGWDGRKFTGTSMAPQLWASEVSGDYQIDALNNINGTLLTFLRGTVDTTYTLTFVHESEYSSYPALYLMDLVNNSVTDITRSGTTYSFTDTSSVPVGRFKIVTSPGMTTEAPSINQVDLQVYSIDKTFFVQNKTPQKGYLNVFDVSGRYMCRLDYAPQELTRIPTRLPSGTYLVKGYVNMRPVSVLLMLK